MTTVWTGLSLGAIYALVALGYNIVFVSSGTFNFAHAQLMMLGTFVTYWGLVTLQLPFAIVALLAAAVVGLVAAIEERVAIRPVRGDQSQLVTTVGAATLIDGIIEVVWGEQPRRVPFFGSTKTLNLLGGFVTPDELVILSASVGLAIAITVLSRRSLVGVALLALAEDREAAQLRGINVRGLALAAFAFSGVLAGGLGVIIGPKTFAVSSLASSLALIGFVALAIGGFGSVIGGLIGGLAVGLVEAFTGRYLPVEYSDLMVFALLLLVLLVRPNGLFGRRQERMV